MTDGVQEVTNVLQISKTRVNSARGASKNLSWKVGDKLEMTWVTRPR